jgi:hypothetical protein
MLSAHDSVFGVGRIITFAFDFRRVLDQLDGQFSQLLLRFSVRQQDSEPPTCLGLISEIDGTWGHSRPSVTFSLVQMLEPGLIKTAHSFKRVRAPNV